MTLEITPRWERAMTGPGYPPHLAASPRPPRTLYGRGDAAAVASPGLAVIGARRATPYGLECARRFAGWAASRGVVIVSGAANGCDQAAHRAALDAGGRTVAVLGSGADVPYPRNARTLLDRIADDGAVVSEQPWGTQPLPYMFAERNRIIAALAAAVLVVEAGLPSGTFSTADHAAEAGRQVLVVPGAILFEGSRGCNRLLRQGAHPITDISDLADELRDCGLLEPGREGIASATGEMGAEGGLPPDQAPLTGEARRVRDACMALPSRPDDLARQLGLDVIAVARALATLQAAGSVARYPDGRFGAGSR